MITCWALKELDVRAGDMMLGGCSVHHDSDCSAADGADTQERTAFPAHCFRSSCSPSPQALIEAHRLCEP